MIPTPAVGVVCLKGDEVLLIRRGTPPRQGEWSLPGGRIEPGERLAVAALRELREETGVAAELIGLIDVDSMPTMPNRSGLEGDRSGSGRPVVGVQSACGRVDAIPLIASTDAGSLSLVAASKETALPAPRTIPRRSRNGSAAVAVR